MLSLIVSHAVQARRAAADYETYALPTALLPPAPHHRRDFASTRPAATVAQRTRAKEIAFSSDAAPTRGQRLQTLAGSDCALRVASRCDVVARVGADYWAGTASGRNSEGEAQADRRQLELEVRRAKPRSDFELVRSAKAFL